MIVRTTLLAALALQAANAFAQGSRAAELADLTLEELASIPVMSVSRRDEPLSEAAASIYVITADDIRRSGATTLPEALRLAPNLNVARIDASQYAISARGFSAVVSNKLLVLIDGRTVYTPLFSGVFWDQQDVMLEDVDRIEVISGPGATLWGANAVNGVINVITRPAADTQGGLLSAGAGNLEQGAAFRHGGALGDRGHFRVYGKSSRFENTRNSGGAAVADGRDWAQLGFRADLGPAANRFTLQGDAYEGKAEDRGIVPGFMPLARIEAQGANLLARWTLRQDDGAEFRLQSYLDHSVRKDPVLFQPESDIFDVEFQHALAARGAHRLMWGGGYRRGRDNVTQGILAGFRPASRKLEWANLFVQDQLRLGERLELTAGLKLERNEYSGVEHLPSVRLAWQPAASQLLWAAVSRAVRAPSRFDRDVFDPLFGFVVGGPHFEPEVAQVYEVGYRGQSGSRLSYSATLFRHEWDGLRSGEGFPVRLENRLQGPIYGVEAWGSWQAAARWRLSGGFTVLRKDLDREPGSTDSLGGANVTLGNDPEYYWLLRSAFTPAAGHEFDVMLRHVASLPAPPVAAYTTVDLRYGWTVRRGLELSLTARLNDAHPEFRTSVSAAVLPSEFERGVFLKAKLTY